MAASPHHGNAKCDDFGLTTASEEWPLAVEPLADGSLIVTGGISYEGDIWWPWEYMFSFVARVDASGELLGVDRVFSRSRGVTALAGTDGSAYVMFNEEASVVRTWVRKYAID